MTCLTIELNRFSVLKNAIKRRVEIETILRRKLPTNSSTENARDRLLLHVWHEMPVAATLLVGLVPDKLIYDPLIDTSCGQA